MASKREIILDSIKARLETVTQIKKVVRYAPIAQALASADKPCVAVIPLQERIADIQDQIADVEVRELLVGLVVWGAEQTNSDQDTELNDVLARMHFVLEGWSALDGSTKLFFPMRWMETDSWWSHQAVPMSGIMAVYAVQYGIIRGDPWDGDVS
jgi:hypothetical protein